MTAIERWTGKPRVVQMMLWDGTEEAWHEPEHRPSQTMPNPSRDVCWVNCPVGHRIAKGRLGEFYPISPAALEAGYVPAADGER